MSAIGYSYFQSTYSVVSKNQSGNGGNILITRPASRCGTEMWPDLKLKWPPTVILWSQTSHPW